MVETLDDAWFAELEFQDGQERFKDWRKWTYSFLTNALAGETGEVCNLAKKLDGGGTHNVGKYKPADLHEELADVFIYLCLTAERLGLDARGLAQAVADKVKKNYERMEDAPREARRIEYFSSENMERWTCPQCACHSIKHGFSEEPGSPWAYNVWRLCASGHFIHEWVSFA